MRNDYPRKICQTIRQCIYYTFGNTTHTHLSAQMNAADNKRKFEKLSLESRQTRQNDQAPLSYSVVQDIVCTDAVQQSLCTSVPVQPLLSLNEAKTRGVRVAVIETRRSQNQPNRIACVLTLGVGEKCEGKYAYDKCEHPCELCGAIAHNVPLPSATKTQLRTHHHRISHITKMVKTPGLTGIRGHQCSVQAITKTLTAEQMQQLHVALGGEEALPRFSVCIQSRFVKPIVDEMKTDERRRLDIVGRFMVSKS